MPAPLNHVAVAVDDHYANLGLKPWLLKLARRSLKAEGVRDAELSILITGDEQVRAYNRVYRGYDEPTDVLSFGLSELAKPAVDDADPDPGFVLPPDAARQLGEVIIAFQTAQRQAAEQGHSLNAEIAHLLVHGILHLLGHDHYEPKETRVMRAREAALLAQPFWELV